MRPCCFSKLLRLHCPIDQDNCRRICFLSFQLVVIVSGTYTQYNLLLPKLYNVVMSSSVINVQQVSLLRSVKCYLIYSTYPKAMCEKHLHTLMSTFLHSQTHIPRQSEVFEAWLGQINCPTLTGDGIYDFFPRRGIR